MDERRNAVIIGGTKGSGRVFAERLAASGCRVCVLGRSRPDDLIARGVDFFETNLEDERSVRQSAERIAAEFSPVHILGFFQRYRGEGDVWAGEFQVTLNATRAVIERLRDSFDERGAAIVAVTSHAAGFVAAEQPAGYHAFKAGLSQLLRYYAVELGPSGIRVNAVSTTVLMKNENEEHYRSNPALANRFASLAPLRRMPSADDIADAAVFLCGPSSSMITGQTIEVDGGATLQSIMSVGAPCQSERAGS